MAEAGIDTRGLESLTSQEEEIKQKLRKTITIRTTREPNDSGESEYFPEELNYRYHMSGIEFSHPVIVVLHPEKHKKLKLITTWFNGAFGRDPYWHSWMNDERGVHILSGREFGNLAGSFYDYSESRLREWQQQGLDYHEGILAKIKDLYYKPGQVIIPKNFLG